MTEATKVFVLLYQHKHGTDVGVYASEDLADKARDELVTEYRNDFDIDSSISRDVAARHWFEMTGGRESFDIRGPFEVKAC